MAEGVSCFGVCACHKPYFFFFWGGGGVGGAYCFTNSSSFFGKYKKKYQIGYSSYLDLCKV